MNAAMIENQNIKQVSKKKLTIEDGAYEHVSEEALARNAVVASGTIGLPGMQRVDNRGEHEISGPYHRRRCNEETPANPSH
jgi:hypothetical protein